MTDKRGILSNPGKNIACYKCGCKALSLVFNSDYTGDIPDVFFNHTKDLGVFFNHIKDVGCYGLLAICPQCDEPVACWSLLSGMLAHPEKTDD